ncbi:type III secretion system export apparatus subunit SctT [Burkholderia sp. Bp8998]|uniref:type III secretion system export apparatus subunit SctT n=1 Tax=Burkholderia sp. Bp8998 TaxID=2184557 RepID=UPI000F592C53|nr:type III secretion system export apparatus subunit SctT [Burkholderia sp. Bp8998]RQS15887.1 EscT/YscT/HrcT family type III secretion system export apparatus protein [Burkholderia sp. Bp8998]
MNVFESGIPQFGGVLLQFFTLVGLCGVRLLVIMIVFPPTSDQVLQGTTRNAIVMLWGAYIAFGQQALMPALSGWHLVLLGAKEALIGLVMAFVASPVFWVAESVGTYIDDLTGYNNVQMSNPSQGQQSSLMATLMSQCASVAFWTLGGMTLLLGALFESYRLWPLDSMTPVPAAMVQMFVMQQTDSLMETVAKVAAPALLLLLLVDVGINLVSKTAQKLDLVSLAQPVKGGIAVLTIALLIGTFIGEVRDQVALVHIGEQIRELAAPHARH